MILDYLKGSITDTMYVAKLHFLIKESQEKHPFDKLNTSQKELFESLRKNAGDNYYLVEKDLVSISNELFDKNNDIESYLDKSNQSYILSIIALLITFLQFFPVIWKELKKRIIKKLDSFNCDKEFADLL